MEYFDEQDSDEDDYPGKKSGSGSSRKLKSPETGGKKKAKVNAKPGSSIALGGVVEQAQQNFMENPKPFKLGNLYCFWYNKQGNPRIVIGPDWKFSVLEMILVNGIVGSILHAALAASSMTLFWVGFGILAYHDLAFLMTIMWNQGLPARNPNAHSKSYLNRVNTIE